MEMHNLQRQKKQWFGHWSAKWLAAVPCQPAGRGRRDMVMLGEFDTLLEAWQQPADLPSIPQRAFHVLSPGHLRWPKKKGSPSCYIWGTCQLFWPKSAVVYCSNLVCDCLKIRDHKINGSSVRAIPLTLVFFKWIRTSPASTWSKKFQSKRSCKWKT